MPQTKPKRKRCKVCNTMFEPRSSFQVVCSPLCAMASADRDHARKVKAKLARKAKREFNWTDRAWLVGQADEAFNRYIRLRDQHRPCVSCGTTTGQFHAGHYRPKGTHPALRYDEANVHGQCAQCNNMKSGNLTEYRKGLIDRIGISEVERLDGPESQATKLQTIEYLQEVIHTYRRKCKEAERGSR